MAIPSAEYGTAKYGESLYGTVVRNPSDTVTVSDAVVAKKLQQHTGGHFAGPTEGC